MSPDKSFIEYPERYAKTAMQDELVAERRPDTQGQDRLMAERVVEGLRLLQVDERGRGQGVASRIFGSVNRLVDLEGKKEGKRERKLKKMRMNMSREIENMGGDEFEPLILHTRSFMEDEIILSKRTPQEPLSFEPPPRLVKLTSNHSQPTNSSDPPLPEQKPWSTGDYFSSRASRSPDSGFHQEKPPGRKDWLEPTCQDMLVERTDIR